MNKIYFSKKRFIETNIVSFGVIKHKLKVFFVYCQKNNIEKKQYRKKDLTESHSESAIFIGYCRQSTGYVFYVPHKHQVVSRRDAVFNQAYFPARVG